MQKRKVHEIAKEYHVTNREILEFLKSRNVDVKSHMSSVDTPQEKLIQEEFSRRSGKQIENTEAKSQLQRETNHKEKTESKENKEVKGQERTTVRPKKKNLIQVFRPQNAKTPEGKNFHKNAVKPGAKQGTKSAKAAPKPEPARKKAAPKAEPAAKAEAAPKAEPISREETAAKVASRMASAAKAIARPEKTETAPKTAPSAKEEPAIKAASQAETVPGVEKDSKGQTQENREKQLNTQRTRQTETSQAETAKADTERESSARAETVRGDSEARGQKRTPRSQAVSGTGQERRGTGQRRTTGGTGQERRSTATGQMQGQRRQDGDRRSAGGGQRSGSAFGQRRDGQGQRGFGGARTGDGSRTPRTGDGQRTGSFGQRRQDGDRRGPGAGRGFAQGGDGRRQTPFDNKRSDSRKPAASEDMGLAKKPSRDGKKEKNKEREKVSQRENKMTNDRRTGGNRPNQGFRQNSRLPKALQKPARPQPKKEEPKEVIKEIQIPEKLTIRELAEAMKKQPSEIVKKLFMQGMLVTVNQEIDYEKASEIALEYDIIAEPEEKVDVIAELLKEDEESEDEMVSRPPVVCVMGHVDHGKTSLLDAIRNTRVTDKEAGGITQAIGASVVSINGRKITFLDTPGHEAFTAMRMRGATSTDIAVLVVAADDGVMPQTLEAISHAKAAGVEIIVAVNKIDKPGANIDRVKQELSEQGLVPEDWGGSTICVPVSAKTHEGIEDLLEMILLTADVMELKANANRRARGLVIEAKLDKGKGPVASILVQKGTLHVGDFIAAGACSGKVRAMMDDMGRRVKSVGPSVPVEILGLNDVPNAGEVLVATENDKEAKNFAATFISENKNKLLEETKSRMSLDDLFSQIKEGNLKELNLIVKADVQGSVEAVKQSLTKLSNEEILVKVIHSGAGIINESDVSLAAASNAIIIGFNVKVDATAKATADHEGVDVRLYSIIYQAIEDVEAAMKGMLDPIYEEKVIGHAEIRQIFKASGVGNIAGSYVMDGLFQRGCKVRITREGKQIFEGNLASLRRFKDDVKEVKTGFECGLLFEGFNEIQELDMVEAYIMVEVPR